MIGAGPKPTGRGFTLVELLVVIAIIGLLVTLIVPGLRSARERSGSAKCMSNLRQIGIAANLWAADWNGRLPPYSFDSSGPSQAYVVQALGGHAQSWTDYRVLGQYLGNDHEWTGDGIVKKTSALFCPSDRQVGPASVVNSHGEGSAWSSYGWNAALSPDYYQQWGQSVTLKSIETSLSLFSGAKTIMAIDSHYSRWHPGNNPYLSPACHGSPEPISLPNWGSSDQYGTHWNWARRHNNGDGGNVLFIDGNVQSVSGDELREAVASRNYLIRPLNRYN